MKFLLLTGFLFMFFAQSRAQQNHYIYIQTENKQSFFVKTNDKVYSSSSSGYLIISKLPEGSYDLLIGFPKNEWPEQHYSLKLGNKDEGFSLKNFDTKGWGLFNLQTMEVVMNADHSTVPEEKKETRNDGFSNTLADVVNTSSIKQKDETKPSVVKQDEVAKDEPVKPAIISSKANRSIEQVFTLLDNSGRTMIYVVTDEYRSDTIKVFMPYKPEEVKQDLRAKGKTVEKKKDIKTGKTVSALNNANAPLVIAPGDSSRISGNSIAKAVNANSGRNECKTNASQNDFIKLRKEMAAQDGDEEMIAIARKTFRIKCFSSEQVKNLSVLFLKDEGKYNFLDAAYLHVNDESNFSQLESLLTDAYYLNRFRAMLRH